MEIVIGAAALLAIAGGALLWRRRGAGPDRRAWTARRLAGTADRLRGAADRVAAPRATTFRDMAERLERIRAHVRARPAVPGGIRRLAGHHAAVMADLADDYADLEARTRPEQADRLDALGAQFADHLDVLDRLDAALVEADFARVEAAMEVLDLQLARLPQSRA
ncbi:hypothetical protein JQC91_17220 [Jannaschia sp. Os4]|uniref:hypothetical protein n=1 Tax=Jannaschia sp. Os4 TaxID=2807617 RepID=UPI0019394A63|nr:hypothetical protein [Jannaschia sp. Os4]MBM2578050.1 hypothetical protein [Jannaschia sp. Os4]